jgi:ferritin-like metal-binding protein YciE
MAKKSTRGQAKKITNKAGAKVRRAAKAIKKAVKKAITPKKYGNLHELLILKLQSLYDIEVELTKALPKLAKAATSDELTEAFESHLMETKGHVTRLEEAMRLLDVEPRKEKVAGIRGIAEDGDWVAGHTSPMARDAALIAAAQYAEHYEIAGYGSAREWAAMMDHQEVADLLETTLNEEEAANEKLSELAHSGINQRAGGIPMEETEEEVALM